MSAVFAYWPALIDGLITTIWVAITSILGSAVVSLILGTLRISRKSSLRIIASLLIEVFRCASALVFLFWVFYALPLLPGMPRLSPIMASIGVLALVGGAYGAEIVRGAIESINSSQSDACHALGLTPWQGLTRVILPQALSQIVPSFGSLAADLVKWTSIISFVGVQDIFYVANTVRSVTYQTVSVFTLLAAIYWTICLLSSLFFRFLEHFLPLNRALRLSAQQTAAG